MTPLSRPEATITYRQRRATPQMMEPPQRGLRAGRGYAHQSEDDIREIVLGTQQVLEGTGVCVEQTRRSILIQRAGVRSVAC